MPTVVLALLAIVVLAVLIIVVVLVGMHGVGRTKAPDLANAMARTARQLNGEGQPPRGLMLLFNEMDEVSAADLDPRQIPGKIRSSIASARSAASAPSPTPPAEVAADPSPPPVAVATVDPPTKVSVAASPIGASGPESGGEDLAEQLAAALASPVSLDEEDPYGLNPEADPDDPYGVNATDDAVVAAEAHR
ncbi:MAG: hypothetical protein ACK5LN_05265 [Propioniciclava sp.]